MKRKLTSLDISEANFIFAHVMLELNKNEKFNNLVVTQRNKLIDEICLEVIDKANKDEDDKEILKSEILAYKIPGTEKKKHPLEIVNLEKPGNFNEIMRRKYENIIRETVKKRIKKLVV